VLLGSILPPQNGLLSDLVVVRMGEANVRLFGRRSPGEGHPERGSWGAGGPHVFRSFSWGRFCDNRVVPIGGGGTFEELALATADVASRRFISDEKEQPSG